MLKILQKLQVKTFSQFFVNCIEQLLEADEPSLYEKASTYLILIVHKLLNCGQQCGYDNCQILENLPKS
jgi:hypothetical protein